MLGVTREIEVEHLLLYVSPWGWILLLAGLLVRNGIRGGDISETPVPFDLLLLLLFVRVRCSRCVSRLVFGAIVIICQILFVKYQFLFLGCVFVSCHVAVADLVDRVKGFSSRKIPFLLAPNDNSYG